MSGVLDNSRFLFRTVALEDVDMEHLVWQVAALFSHRLDKIEFVDGELPPIRTVPFLLEHIFSNLMDNALKYLAPCRPGRIEVGG